LKSNCDMSQLLFFWSKKVWLQGTIPEENNMLKTLPWYWPKFEFIYLRHPIVPCNSCCSSDSILHRWCNGWHTLLECDRSWVRAQSSQTKDYKISICCFSAKHAALRRKSKDWLAWNHENVFKLSNMTYLPVNCCFSELALKKYN
jgi:hypothetical protein